MIEIIPRIIGEEDYIDLIGHKIYIDGVLLSSEQGHAWHERSSGRFEVEIFDENLKPKIINLSFADLLGEIGSLELVSYNIFPGFHRVVESFTRMDDEAVAIKFGLRFDVDNWKNPWSIGDFRDELVRTWGDHPIEGATLENNIQMFPTISLEPLESSTSSTVGDQEAKWLGQIQSIIQKTYDSLAAKAQSDKLVTHFNFPKEAQVACEQYLLYFIQFLKDLGVEANAQIQHESGQVLFEVIPKDGKEALEKIREALDAYLELPTHVGLQAVMGPGTEIEVQQLYANIQHLNGQLMLAHAVMQAKDATIEAKESTILQLRRGELFVESTPHQSRGEDKEVILGGLASVKTYEGKGFDVNLPMLFRKLRDSFSRKA